jgi:hypothetical protein
VLGPRLLPIWILRFQLAAVSSIHLIHAKQPGSKNDRNIVCSDTINSSPDASMHYDLPMCHNLGKFSRNHSGSSSAPEASSQLSSFPDCRSKLRLLRMRMEPHNYTPEQEQQPLSQVPRLHRYTSSTSMP